MQIESVILMLTILTLLVAVLVALFGDAWIIRFRAWKRAGRFQARVLNLCHNSNTNEAAVGLSVIFVPSEATPLFLKSRGKISLGGKDYIVRLDSRTGDTVEIVRGCPILGNADFLKPSPEEVVQLYMLLATVGGQLTFETSMGDLLSCLVKCKRKTFDRFISDKGVPNPLP
jgi:hypothetical protein